MATVRLFAGLREAAGTGRVDLDGSTVAELLAAASERFGIRFEEGLHTARIWVNGDPAEPSTKVTADDEVAIIPPVSGGTTTIVEQREPFVQAGFGAFAWLGAAVAAAASVEASAVVIALLAALWAIDAAAVASLRALRMGRIPAVLAGGLSAGAAYAYGLEGFGGAVAGAVVISLLAVVLRPRLRPIDISSPTLLLAMASALFAGSFVLVRMRSVEESYVLLLVVGVAALSAWAASRTSSPSQLFDPNLSAVVVGTVAGIAGGMLWGANDGAVFLAAVAATAGFVAGRTAGAVIRLGYVALAAQAPGYMSLLDGAVLGTASFWLVLALLG